MPPVSNEDMSEVPQVSPATMQSNMKTSFNDGYDDFCFGRLTLRERMRGGGESLPTFDRVFTEEEIIESSSALRVPFRDSFER